MVRLLNPRQTVHLKNGRGIDGCRLSLCEFQEPEMQDLSKKEHMNEIIDKLAKIKIVNPSKGARAKKEIKDKYITI